MGELVCGQRWLPVHGIRRLMTAGGDSVLSRRCHVAVNCGSTCDKLLSNNDQICMNQCQ